MWNHRAVSHRVLAAAQAGEAGRPIGYVKGNIMLRKTLVLCLLAAFLVAGPMGCGSKVSKSNYDKITTGMSKADVEKIMGAGEKASAGISVGGLDITGDVYTWKDGDKQITVVFKDEKVVSKTSQNVE
jgi:hypothetical protein